MVDEQFPLQRKILKGQVVVRNEETSVHARSEKWTTAAWISASFFFFFFLFSFGSFIVLYSHVWYMHRLTHDKVKHWDAPAGLQRPECQVEIKFLFPSVFFFFFFFFCYKWLKEKERDLHTNTCAQQSSTRKIHNTNVIHTHGCCGGAGRWDCFQGGTCSGMWECRGSAGAEKGGMENTIPQFIFSGLSTFLKPRGGMRASSKLPLILL